MKTLTIIVIIALIGFVGWKAIQTKPDASVPEAKVVDTTTPTVVTDPAVVSTQQQTLEVANDLVAVTFRGFGPGKEHVGSFGKVTSTLAYADGAFNGGVVIDMNSMSTDTEKLTGHLKTKDFFDTATYPTAKFIPIKWEISKVAGKENIITGELTLHGVKKVISFPVAYQEVVPAANVRLAYTKSYTSTFTINLKDFGINQAFANEQFEVTLIVPVR